MRDDSEIRELREELAKLRERVAVLEAQRWPPSHVYPSIPPYPNTAPWMPPFVVTSETAS